MTRQINDKVRATLEAVSSGEWSREDRDLLIYAMLVKRNDAKTLNWMLEQAPDRNAFHERILDAVHLVKGPDHTFSVRGFLKTIDGRFTDAQKAEIARLLGAFSRHLRDSMEIQSFITSGTLLGLVREGKFLAHDDDFDMAYISNCTEKPDIVSERKRILDVISASPSFRAEESTGGRATVFVTGETTSFKFDLFAGYRNGDFFNEFPLKPDTARFDDIAPVRTMTLYGEEVFVPRVPEALLEVNFGAGWRVPDPSFRFNFGEHLRYYRFLRDAVDAPAKDIKPRS